LSKGIRHIFSVLLLFSASLLVAQSDFEDDAALWLNFYFEKKLTDNLDAHVEFKNRFNNNVSDYGLGALFGGFSYEINKYIKAEAEYGWGKTRNINGTYSNRHRGNLSLTFKKKFGAFSVSYRNLVQIRMRDIYNSENGTVPVYMNRNKLTLKYEINKRITAYAYEELYLPFYQVRNKGLSRSRSAAGIEYVMTKKITLEGYFLLQHELNAFNKTNRDFIYGLTYSHKF